jgi:hypothetical protein
MGRPPPEGARVAYALAQFIFIVRDPIDTLSSCIIALANGGALWKATWQRENNLKLIKGTNPNGDRQDIEHCARDRQLY